MEETNSATIYTALLLLLLLLLLFTLILISIRCLFRSNNSPLPPGGPLALPIIGHLHLLRQPLHQTLARISSLHGPLLLLRFGLRPVLVLTSPSAAEECLTKNDVTFANRPFLFYGQYLGRGNSDLATAPYGPHWRNQRRVTTLHVFSSACMAALSSTRAAVLRSLLRKLKKSGNDEGFRTVNMKEELSELTFNTIVAMIGGTATEDTEEGRRFRRVIVEAFYLSGSSNIEDFFPFVRWVGVKGNVNRMVKVAAELDECFQGMVEKRRRMRAKEAVPEGEEKTIINVMLELQEKGDEFYTDDVIKGIIQVLIVAGTDTSAGTMEWALSLLLNNPEVLTKAREEIEMQVGHDRLLTDSDLSNLPYLHNVIKETIRLFPAGPLLVPHYSSKDCMVGGYHVPSGTMLLINAYAMHRDPNLWEDALKFRPERFEHGEVEGYKYIPFGSGRRKCPGEALAMKMTALALGSLIQCFEWKRIGDEEVDLTEGEGLTLPKAIPLEAMYKPCETMTHILAQL